MSESLNNFIREFCIAQELTLEELAKQATISRSSLYKLLEEDYSPTIKNIVKLANATNVHPQYLLKLKWSSCDLHDLSTGADKDIEKTINDATVFIDETIPDNSIIATGCTFTKTWTVQNVGNQIWESRYLVCVDDVEQQQSNTALKPESTQVMIPKTFPGETVTLSIDFTAPNIPARVISYWKSADSNGNFHFPKATGLSVSVKVISSEFVQA